MHFDTNVETNFNVVEAFTSMMKEMFLPGIDLKQKVQQYDEKMKKRVKGKINQRPD